jgi:hypothetical protein
MLGHKNILTTQIYAKVSRKKISTNMEELERKLFTQDGKLKFEGCPGENNILGKLVAIR